MVEIEILFDSEADMQKIVELGFEVGFTSAQTNLDQYLEQQFKLRRDLRNGSAARTATYLNFPGTTEEAFSFYKKVFNTEFNGGGIRRFGDIPPETGNPPVPENVRRMVLHVELPTLGGHVLMGTDAPKELGFSVEQGNNMHICLEPESREETQRIFVELSAGGKVSMDLQDMFWGAYYGSFTDRYGINWMVNFVEK
jgi:uncharacterized glyoxalase superfamily protein PhnB